MKDTLFVPVGSTPWKMSGEKITHAASTRSGYSIVPLNYDAGVLPVDDESCLRCHKDAGRQISDFHGDLVLYGELWGEDEIFSWHPFENEAFVDEKGDVKNFNNDNRRLRQDFVKAGLVETYQQALHPPTLYKALPREWKYNPVR